ncbi:MAG: class I SAM-dependent methyltransferase [Planctomycetia bacterium]|nr:class I SAM-dependent methyltransferase [Planctomycetia bacterium]
MAKQNEIDYPVRLGEWVLKCVSGKPFADPHCGRLLIRLGTILSLLPERPARILDLGCGTGWTSQFFARAGHEVVGADISPGMIRVANDQRDAAGLTNLTFVVADYEQLNFRDEFDAVVFFDSLHHAEDERLAIAKAFAALKPGGVCLTAEPGRGHHDSEEARAAVAEYGVTEKDMPPEHIVDLGRQVGFASFRVFPHPDQVGVEIYDHRAKPVDDPFADTDPAFAPPPRPSILKRAIRRLFSRRTPPTLPPWRLTNVDHLLLHIRSNGLVLMRKPDASELRAAA